ncbi:MAG: T9SS type A sorting domain-containing protein [Bacteroidales bacterium]|nr:T9SS type A sorting domain-containing protein [Bacteroidales bacterium]
MNIRIVIFFVSLSLTGYNTFIFCSDPEPGNLINTSTAIIPGNLVINSDTTWNSDTIKAFGNITVSSGFSLTISKGVFIEFQGYYAIIVQGKLNSYGAIDEPVTITINDTTGFSNWSSQTGGWQGLRFQNNVSAKSVVQYTIIEYAKATDQPFLGLGGGIYISDYKNVEVSNCIIRNNYARIGAGLFCNNTEAEISHNLIHSNRSDDGGGGIFCVNANTKILNNVIVKNISSKGAGLFFQNSVSPKLYNNTICENTASEFGGGIYFYQGSNPTLRNNIFCSNTADVKGNQVYILPDSRPSFYNCNIQGGLNELFEPPDTAYPGTAVNIINVPSDFVKETEFDYSLSETSQCIDAGDNTDINYDLDFQHNIRIWDGNMNDTAIVDIGAYEFGAPLGLRVTYKVKDVTVEGASNGELTINIEGGVPPYRLLVTGLLFSENFDDLDTNEVFIDNLKTGKYTIRVWDNSDFYFITDAYIDFNGIVDFSISGNVYTRNGPLDNGMVIAFLKNNNNYIPTDIVQVYKGEYLFENIDSAQYILYAIPNPYIYPEHLPTFFPNTLYWDAANVIKAYGNAYNVDIYLEYFVAQTTGSGEIGGSSVFEDTLSYETPIFKIPWFGSEITNPINTEDAARNIPVIIFQENKPVGWALSDEYGDFGLKNLPEGTYHLIIQKPGLPMYNTPTFDLNEENPDEKTIKIFIRSRDIFTSIEKFKTDWFIEIGPNPVKNSLNIDLNHYDGLFVNLRLTNMLGQIIYQNNYYKPQGVTNLQIYLGNLVSGVYYLGIDVENYSDAFKIIKE